VALAVALAASASPAAALVQPSGTGPLPVTTVTGTGAGGDRLYQGVGAVLGGGGNARYLMDYPEPERGQMLDYLFKPGYGAALQLLKLEIGGGANSSDGAEPSVEPVRGPVNCDAGYEFSIARQAVARNPGIRLYGLQWTAPGWGGHPAGSVFTSADIGYLLTWLGCAARHGLTISYLGGWNESDDSTHAAISRRLVHVHRPAGLGLLADHHVGPGQGARRRAAAGRLPAALPEQPGQRRARGRRRRRTAVPGRPGRLGPAGPLRPRGD
jgi:Glycosyl hydrolase family 59